MTPERDEDDHHLKELRFQLTVTRAMLGTMDLDKVLYIILSGITHGDGLNFNRACLFLTDGSRRELRPTFAVGPTSGADAQRIWADIAERGLDLDDLLASYEAADPAVHPLTRQLSRVVVPLSGRLAAVEGPSAPVEAVIQWVVRARAAFFSNTLRAEVATDHGHRLEFHPVACVPLLLGDSILGVILADNGFNHRPITDSDMRSLATVGNLAAIAVNQARMHAQLLDMAERDGLTGLFNRHYYEAQLQREVGRAQRAGRPLAMIVLDLDHFKAINDRFGHEVGDRVLKEVATVLQSGVRSHDIVARYGGEELVIVVTGGASRGEAFQIAEKLRRTVERRAIGGCPPGAVTVSAGVASLPAERLSASALFRLADEAVYQAKREGRNRVVLSESL